MVRKYHVYTSCIIQSVVEGYGTMDETRTNVGRMPVRYYGAS